MANSMPRKKKEEVGVEDVIQQGERLVKTSLTLGYETWKKAKVWGLEKGLTLAQVTEAALKKYLEIEKAEVSQQKKRSS